MSLVWWGAEGGEGMRPNDMQDSNPTEHTHHWRIIDTVRTWEGRAIVALCDKCNEYLTNEQVEEVLNSELTHRP